MTNVHRCHCIDRLVGRSRYSLPAYTRVTNFCYIFNLRNGGRLIHGTAYTRVYTVFTKKTWNYIGRQCTKTQHSNELKKCEVVNKLFSWALVHKVAICRFHACVYRSFYRIFNALVSAKSLLNMLSHISCTSTQTGPCQIRCLWIWIPQHLGNLLVWDVTVLSTIADFHVTTRTCGHGQIGHCQEMQEIHRDPSSTHISSSRYGDLGLTESLGVPFLWWSWLQNYWCLSWQPWRIICFSAAVSISLWWQWFRPRANPCLFWSFCYEPVRSILPRVKTAIIITCISIEHHMPWLQRCQNGNVSASKTCQRSLQWVHEATNGAHTSLESKIMK